MKTLHPRSRATNVATLRSAGLRELCESLLAGALLREPARKEACLRPCECPVRRRLHLVDDTGQDGFNVTAVIIVDCVEPTWVRVAVRNQVDLERRHVCVCVKRRQPSYKQLSAITRACEGRAAKRALYIPVPVLTVGTVTY